MSRTVVVTGAAGGIGAACVSTLNDRGWTVIGLDVDDSDTSWACDVTSLTDVERVAARVADLGGCSALVNVAGVLRPSRVTDISAGDIRAMLDVNVLGVLHALQGFAEQLVDNRGAVVTVASNAAGTPRMSLGAYGATKAAATMLTHSFALENAASGVRGNVVQPGSTRTPMLESLWSSPADEQATLRGDLAAHRLGIPLGRIAEPTDIAATVAFLISDDARHITLQELYVDGGATL
ncbi:MULTISPECIES: SDR family oxidoreductase [Gordonia]|uniref:SDR family oxidoreductase n=1 Tax=Gordonia TaxID=2053 RepID=UPI0030C787FB